MEVERKDDNMVYFKNIIKFYILLLIFLLKGKERIMNICIVYLRNCILDFECKTLVTVEFYKLTILN
jgi:hypothetical protein